MSEVIVLNLRIRNSKDNLVDFSQKYLNELLSGVYVEFIINGVKFVDTIESVSSTVIDEELHLVFNFKSDDIESQNVPLLEETKANIGFQIVVIETKNHTTVIEVLD